MARAEHYARAAYFAPLLAGAAVVLTQSGRAVPPWAVFVVLSLYAQAGAQLLRLAGSAKALLFLETLPFLGLAAAALGDPGAPRPLLTLACGTAAGAALLVGEGLWAASSGPFISFLLFAGASALAATGLACLTPPQFLGSALLVLGLAGYGLLRRVRR